MGAPEIEKIFAVPGERCPWIRDGLRMHFNRNLQRRIRSTYCPHHAVDSFQLFSLLPSDPTPKLRSEAQCRLRPEVKTTRIDRLLLVPLVAAERDRTEPVRRPGMWVGHQEDAINPRCSQ